MLRPTLCLALTACLLGSCVTGAAVIRKDWPVSLPLLLGLVAADLVVGSIAFGQLDSMSAPGAIASGVALTGVDLGIGCVLGACAVLRP